MNDLTTYLKYAITGLVFDAKRLWVNPLVIFFVVLCVYTFGIQVIIGFVIISIILSMVYHGIYAYIKDGKVKHVAPKKSKAESSIMKDVHQEIVDTKETEVVTETEVTEAVKTEDK